MNDFPKITVQIAMDKPVPGAKEDRDAYQVSANFAAHDSVGFLAKPYTLTHIGCGLAAEAGLKTLEDAKALADKLERVLDWSTVSGVDDPLVVEHHDALKAIRLAHSAATSARKQKRS